MEAEHAEAQLQAAAGTGTRAAVIYASLQHHPGADARLAAIASAAGMAVCGANCMGFLNLEQPLRACAWTLNAGTDAAAQTITLTAS